MSFFGLPKLGAVAPPERVQGPQFLVASMLDLAATKASVLQKRAQAKDYVDMDALINAGVLLANALGAGRALYGAVFEPQITLKALTYFGDGDLPSLPADLRKRLIGAVRAVDLEKLPKFDLLARSA
jgi:Nucleotidyl transferase AbiEii toxin, Type IV TA system